MSYVKCINNQPYMQPPGQPPQGEPLLDLTIGKIYKIVPDPAADRHGMLRVFDESYGEPGSERGYLYPVEYFEPFLPTAKGSLSATVTVHLDDYLKGVLHAEAISADKPISALIRTWIEERLDLLFQPKTAVVLPKSSIGPL